MMQRTQNARFFFLVPRLLRQRQLIEGGYCGAQRSIQPEVGDSTAIECSLSQDIAAADFRKGAEH